MSQPVIFAVPTVRPPTSAHPSTRPVRNWEAEELGHPATLGPTNNLLCGLQQGTEPL